MRSYWMSMSLVAGLLFGYTAIVFNSHSNVGSSQQQTSKNSTEPREPASAAAAAAAQAATAEAIGANSSANASVN